MCQGATGRRKPATVPSPATVPCHFWQDISSKAVIPMKITKVYTRTGDKGMTSLVGGIRIDKSATRLDAYGTIDELSSHIGLLIAYIEQDINDAHILEILSRVHNTLFNVGSYLATDASLFEEKPEWLDGHINGILSQLPAEIETLEQEIDEIQPTLPVLHSFVLPGGTVAASQCHVCRTVCRRTERCIVALSRESEVADEPIKFVNRLSDYLFVLARKLNFLVGKDEKIWKKTCISKKK